VSTLGKEIVKEQNSVMMRPLQAKSFSDDDDDDDDDCV